MLIVGPTGNEQSTDAAAAIPICVAYNFDATVLPYGSKLERFRP